MIDRPNGPSEEETTRIIGQIERHMAELREEKALYAARCKPLHEAIHDTITHAVTTMGFDRKALKVTVRQRELVRKMERLEDDLDAVTQTALDRLQSHLGHFADSPLGRAAMDAARATSRRRKPNPVDDFADDESADAAE